jgi:AcrR family transcriptional regulator
MRTAKRAAPAGKGPMVARRTQGEGKGGSADRCGRSAALRRASEHAMLQLCGEVGYEQTTVASVIERSGSNRSRFYNTYSGKAQCFELAYERAAEDLCGRLLATCKGAADWTTGMRLAVEELEAFTTEDPALARGLIAEVHVAGGAALARHTELVAGFVEAVDRARRERGRPDPEPPPATADFVVDSIEATVIRSLVEGKALREELPGLLFLAVSSFFGAAAARRAVRACLSNG